MCIAGMNMSRGRQRKPRAKTWERDRRYRAKLKQRAVDATANRCEHCSGTKKLQFAHRVPTALEGRGRGSRQRYMDVVLHSECYLRLCASCHYDYDNPAADQGKEAA